MSAGKQVTTWEKGQEWFLQDLASGVDHEITLKGFADISEALKFGGELRKANAYITGKVNGKQVPALLPEMEGKTSWFNVANNGRRVSVKFDVVQVPLRLLGGELVDAYRFCLGRLAQSMPITREGFLIEQKGPFLFETANVTERKPTAADGLFQFDSDEPRAEVPAVAPQKSFLGDIFGGSSLGVSTPSASPAVSVTSGLSGIQKEPATTAKASASAPITGSVTPSPFRALHTTINFIPYAPLVTSNESWLSQITKGDAPVQISASLPVSSVLTRDTNGDRRGVDAVEIPARSPASIAGSDNRSSAPISIGGKRANFSRSKTTPSFSEKSPQERPEPAYASAPVTRERNNSSGDEADLEGFSEPSVGSVKETGFFLLAASVVPRSFVQMVADQVKKDAPVISAQPVTDVPSASPAPETLSSTAVESIPSASPAAQPSDEHVELTPMHNPLYAIKERARKKEMDERAKKGIVVSETFLDQIENPEKYTSGSRDQKSPAALRFSIGSGSSGRRF